MHKYTPWTAVPLCLLLLTACGGIIGGSTGTEEVVALPTTTPLPVIESPQPTATLPPPPTVTPFPSVTPEGGVPVEAGEEPAPEAAEAGEPDEGAAPQATAASEPVAGINPDIPLGPRKYIADFSGGGWYTAEADTLTVSLSLGGYIWEVGPVDAFWIDTGMLDQADFYAQVEVDVKKCPQDAGYGLRFRLVDDSNYYLFAVWCNDTYSIFSLLDGTQGPYISKTELPASLAGQQESTRVVGVLAQGPTFKFYLDGVQVGEFEDADLVSGDVAMWARAGEGVFRAVFDNLEVYELK